MIGALRLAWVVFATGALGGLVWFAHRAGWNSASVSTSEAETAEAEGQSNAMKRMAEAAGQEITDDVLMRRMKGGAA